MFSDAAISQLLCDHLDPRAVIIMRLRYGLGEKIHTPFDIARSLQISRTRVRGIIYKSNQVLLNLPKKYQEKQQEQ